MTVSNHKPLHLTVHNTTTTTTSNNTNTDRNTTTNKHTNTSCTGTNNTPIPSRAKRDNRNDDNDGGGDEKEVGYRRSMLSSDNDYKGAYDPDNDTIHNNDDDDDDDDFEDCHDDHFLDETQDDTDEHDEDPIGTQLTKLLNHSREFRYSPTETEEEALDNHHDNDDLALAWKWKGQPSFHPLLSSTNLYRIRAMFRSLLIQMREFRSSIWKKQQKNSQTTTTTTTTPTVPSSCSNSTATWNRATPTALQSLHTILACLFFLALFLTLTVHHCLLYLFQQYLLVALIFTSLLVDHNELKTVVCRFQLVRMVGQKVNRWWNMFQRDVLLAGELEGRREDSCDGGGGHSRKVKKSPMVEGRGSGHTHLEEEEEEEEKEKGDGALVHANTAQHLEAKTFCSMVQIHTTTTTSMERKMTRKKSSALRRAPSLNNGWNRKGRGGSKSKGNTNNSTGTDRCIVVGENKRDYDNLEEHFHDEAKMGKDGKSGEIVPSSIPLGRNHEESSQERNDDDSPNDNHDDDDYDDDDLPNICISNSLQTTTMEQQQKSNRHHHLPSRGGNALSTLSEHEHPTDGGTDCSGDCPSAVTPHEAVEVVEPLRLLIRGRRKSGGGKSGGRVGSRWKRRRGDLVVGNGTVLDRDDGDGGGHGEEENNEVVLLEDDENDDDDGEEEDDDEANNVRVGKFRKSKFDDGKSYPSLDSFPEEDDDTFLSDDDDVDDDDEEAESTVSALSSRSGFASTPKRKLKNTFDLEGKEMKWLDVGAKIGLRLLNSKHVQKAISNSNVNAAANTNTNNTHTTNTDNVRELRHGKDVTQPNNGERSYTTDSLGREGDDNLRYNNFSEEEEDCGDVLITPRAANSSNFFVSDDDGELVVDDGDGDGDGDKELNSQSEIGSDGTGSGVARTRPMTTKTRTEMGTGQGTTATTTTTSTPNRKSETTTLAKPVHSLWTLPPDLHQSNGGNFFSHSFYSDFDDFSIRSDATSNRSSLVGVGGGYQHQQQQQQQQQHQQSPMRSLLMRRLSSNPKLRLCSESSFTSSVRDGSTCSGGTSGDGGGESRGSDGIGHSIEVMPISYSKGFRNDKGKASPASTVQDPFDANYFLPPSMALTNLSVRNDEKGPESNHGVDRSLSGDGRSKSKVESSTTMGDLDHCLKTPRSAYANKSAQTRSSRNRCRSVLLPGVKMYVPMFPSTPTKPLSTATTAPKKRHCKSFHQMATVLHCKRLYVGDRGEYSLTKKNASFYRDTLIMHQNSEVEQRREQRSNCLSITVLLDKSFLRDGNFAQMTLRILDRQRQMPRHSKFPIGSCVATSFGIGILVGWRVEDDCHIVRSLWQRRGKGSGRAYLNRNALFEVMEGAVGFKVNTTYGTGKVLGYIDGGRDFRHGKYMVLLKKIAERSNGQVMTVQRSEVILCRSAKFIPIIEQIKESAKYQIQLNNYESAMIQRMLEDEESMLMQKTWRIFSEGFELFLSSFIKAAEEDEHFDGEINNFLSVIIRFLEDFDIGNSKKHRKEISTMPEIPEIGSNLSSETKQEVSMEDSKEEKEGEAGLWLMNDIFGDFLKPDKASTTSAPTQSYDDVQKIDTRVERDQFAKESYRRAHAFLKIIMRTVTIARSSCSHRPNLQMALSIIHEVLLFIRTVIKVQQKNMSQASVEAWKKTFQEFVEIFGPMKQRFEKIVKGIAERLETHGNIAKIRAIRFVDIVLSDDRLLELLEASEYYHCIYRLEVAAVQANIIDEESCSQYHKTAVFIYNTMAPRAKRNQEAAARNGEKLTHFAKLLKLLATPHRTLLKLFTNEDLLELIERVFVRIFEREKQVCQMLNIYAFNFRSFSHLRILNNMAICGKLWAPVLDAADEEFNWAMTRMPEKTQEYIRPLSKLFSLGVAQFHQLHKVDSPLTADWLDFLMEDEAVAIIQELDSTLMRSLGNFCNDVKEMMYILPYYSSIDEDILNLIDEVELDKILKEAAEVILDNEKFPEYIREKSAIAVSRFLDYLPKMSIPIEKRDIGEGWVITCCGRLGEDLTLSNVSIRKENLVCKVLGSGNVLSPVIGELKEDKTQSLSYSMNSNPSFISDENGNVEVSILDHVGELIRNAQRHGCWKSGIGGVVAMSPGKSVGTPLEGLPISEVLRCAIELWENLEIDDDELLEIAIRDISYQIQLQKEREESTESDRTSKMWANEASQIQIRHQNSSNSNSSQSFEGKLRIIKSNDSSNSHRELRFNPKKDPTVVYLELNELTCCLDDFIFRIEPMKQHSIFDPIFEGVGSLTIKNASIKLRVECRKERIFKLDTEVTVPVLQLQELEIGLEKVKFKFKETGADWILNKVVSNFSANITEIVKTNLKDQISLSLNSTLDNLNSYIEVNPDLMLTILGINIDDLEENIAWV